MYIYGFYYCIQHEIYTSIYVIDITGLIIININITSELVLYL